MSRGQIEIFLQPGEFYFGDRYTRIRTLLGSCVAVTLWHPRFAIGGMCHFLLPGRIRNPLQDADGRYADEAVQWLMDAASSHGTRPQEYEIKLFGGGNMFRGQPGTGGMDVGARNIEAANGLLALHGLKPRASSVGEYGYRNVFFDVATGHVWVRHVAHAVEAA